MEIRNRETGAVITISEFKAQHPRTAFPKELSVELFDDFGYDPVLNGPNAEVSGPYEVSVRNGVELINGQWFTKFVVGPIFADTEEKTAEEQQQEYRDRIDRRAAEQACRERDAKLKACDWTVLPDSPFTKTVLGKWKSYRQQLRDVPKAEGFPHSFEWPSQPS